ncbi:LOW QUALITY PROTEIN: E3 ubiquitin-protein ligase MARCHF3 [Hoplias malabaricus]|uniref:LOW QUALITY PROTEIN: E3 ubiquitin-protein ligase MARCHF3 n=1 Tax=Hoplias malabaricus TaxID=27720 RepID=UPI0034617C2B
MEGRKDGGMKLNLSGLSGPCSPASSLMSSNAEADGQLDMQSEAWSPGPGPDPVDLDSPKLENKSVEISPGPVQDVPPSLDHVLSMLPVSSCSSLNGLELFCRICHEGGVAAELVSPCVCAGTVGAVHWVCLEHWLTASSTRRCKLCHHEFALECLPKPLTEVKRLDGAVLRLRASLMSFISCVGSMAGLSGWMCVQGAVDLFYSNGLEGVTLFLLTFALFTIYFFWTMVFLRYHVHLFRTWSETNETGTGLSVQLRPHG